MLKNEINWLGILVRFVIAFVLVCLTYNPEGTSYFHWAKDTLYQNIEANWPLLSFAGVVLLIGWTVFLGATLRSLGPTGLFLTLAFFGTLIWLVVDWGVVPISGQRTIAYIIMVVFSGILATGMAWSLIRRRLSGQVDVLEQD